MSLLTLLIQGFIHCFVNIAPIFVFVSRPELLTEQVKQEMPSIPVCDPGTGPEQIKKYVKLFFFLAT